MNSGTVLAGTDGFTTMMTVLKAWLKFNNDDTIALRKLRDEGAEFITVDDSYVAAARKGTREWEDQTSAEGGWFKKVLDA